MAWSLIRQTPGGDPAELYKVVIEGAPAMLWLGDEHGKCVFLNRSLRDFWGVGVVDIATFDWTTTLHPEDGAMLAAPFEEAMRTRSEMTVEARYRRADGEYRTLLTQARPRFDSSGTFVGMVGVNIDVTDQRRNEEDLRAARDALALAMRSANLGLLEWDYTTGRVRWDERGRDVFGLSDERPRISDWMSCIPDEDRSALEAEIARSAATGEPFDFIYRISRADGSERRVQGTGTILTSRRGAPLRGTGLVRDVTEQWRESEFQKLLIGELNHRIKNVLAVLHALIARTDTAGRSAEEFQGVILGRLHAISDGLTLTENSTSDRVCIRDLATTVLKPFEVDHTRIHLEGPAASIPSRLSRMLGLVIHELATNAVKHGALSNLSGKVSLHWTRQPRAGGDRLVLTWRETGGPPVKRPRRTGFGSRLLQRMAALETGGEAEIVYDASGLRYRLGFDVSDREDVPMGQAV